MDRVEDLINKLRDEDWQSCRAAAALGGIKDNEAVEPLIKALKDNDNNIRLKAAIILDKIGWKPANKRELALYRVAKHQWNKLPAVGKEAAEILISVLKDKNSYVREKAVEFLGKIGDASAVEPLIETLNDDYWMIRKASLEALVKIGDARAVRTIIDTFKHGDQSILNASIEVLEKISKKYFGDECNFFCLKCGCRAEKITLLLPPLKRIIYYLCRNCHNNLYLIGGAGKIVLLLDKSVDKDYMQRERTLTLNWFKRKGPIDLDQIRIKDAGDFDIEELVMKLMNDGDDKRRKRLPGIPVYLSRDLKLSQSKINLLKDNFKIVKSVD